MLFFIVRRFTYENNIKMNYFQKEDILHFVISDEKEANSI